MTLRELKDTFSSNTEFELLWGDPYNPKYATLKIIPAVNDSKYLYLGRIVGGIEGIENDLIVLSAEAISKNYVSVSICDTPACGVLQGHLEQEERKSIPAPSTRNRDTDRNGQTIIISAAAIVISAISLLWSIARLLWPWRWPCERRTDAED